MKTETCPSVYEQLPLADGGEEDGHAHELAHARWSRNSERTTRSLCLVLSVLVNGFFLLILAFLWRRSSTSQNDPSHLVYSPAYSAVEYKVVHFHRSIGNDIPLYDRPPSPQVDAAWLDLYMDHVNVRLYEDEAALSVNRTMKVPRGEGYLFTLSMFHQLHCLDEIRKSLDPEAYPDHDWTGQHRRHCVGILRQAVMCNGDISMDVVQWSEKLQMMLPRPDVLHSCRNFERIRDWAKARTIGDDEADGDSDSKTNLEDDFKFGGWP